MPEDIERLDEEFEGAEEEIVTPQDDADEPVEVEEAQEELKWNDVFEGAVQDDGETAEGDVDADMDADGMSTTALFFLKAHRSSHFQTTPRPPRMAPKSPA